MTRVASVAAITDPTVTPVANPGRAIRFQPAHRWRRLVRVTTPKAVTMSEVVPFNKKPRPAANENVVASAGSAEDHPLPPSQESEVLAPAHARLAAKVPHVGSVKRRRNPRRFKPSLN